MRELIEVYKNILLREEKEYTDDQMYDQNHMANLASELHAHIALNAIADLQAGLGDHHEAEKYRKKAIDAKTSAEAMHSEYTGNQDTWARAYDMAYAMHDDGLNRSH